MIHNRNRMTHHHHDDAEYEYVRVHDVHVRTGGSSTVVLPVL
jgi:hypothetical protein